METPITIPIMMAVYEPTTKVNSNVVYFQSLKEVIVPEVGDEIVFEGVGKAINVLSRQFIYHKGGLTRIMLNMPQ